MAAKRDPPRARCKGNAETRFKTSLRFGLLQERGIEAAVRRLSAEAGCEVSREELVWSLVGHALEHGFPGAWGVGESPF